MERRVQFQIQSRILEGGNILEIGQLCLDSIHINNITSNIKKILQNCQKIEYLTLNNCDLKTLNNFPVLPKLIGLQLQDNMLTGDDLQKIGHLNDLHFLTLRNNKISKIQEIDDLSRLRHLEILQVEGNEICNNENYREYIFSRVPNLKILNCVDRYGKIQQQQNNSQYISIIGSSRLDLLERQNEQDFQIDNKTDLIQQNQKNKQIINFKQRKSSFDSLIPTSPRLINKLHFSQRISHQQNNFIFLKQQINNQHYSSQNDFFNHFKKKILKKQ